METIISHGAQITVDKNRDAPENKSSTNSKRPKKMIDADTPRRPTDDIVITRRYVVTVLEMVQEWINHNPNDGADLTSNYALIELIHSKLHDLASASVQ